MELRLKLGKVILKEVVNTRHTNTKDKKKCPNGHFFFNLIYASTSFFAVFWKLALNSFQPSLSFASQER